MTRKLDHIFIQNYDETDPLIISMIHQREISYESAVLMNTVFRWLNKARSSDTLLWPITRKKISNYGAFFNLTDELMAFQAINWSEVIPELKDIDADEKRELQKIASEKFDLRNDNIEFIIEEAVSILLSAGYLVKRCIELKKQMSS